MNNSNDNRQSYKAFNFKMALLGQTFINSLRNNFNNAIGRKQSIRGINPIMDSQVNESIEKVENIKKFIEGSRRSIKKIIENITSTIEAEQSLSLLFSEEGCKEDKNVELNKCYIKCSNTFKEENKILSKYIIPLKNYEDWLTTFLTIAIKDTEDTINLCNQVGIEIQTYTTYLNDAKERLKYEIEGSMEYHNDSKIVETSEYHLEQSNTRFAQLKIQLKEKADMLELKRQADLPNHLDAIHHSIKLYHQDALASNTISPPKNKSDADIIIHTVNVENPTSKGKVYLQRSLPSAVPTFHPINSNNNTLIKN